MLADLLHFVFLLFLGKITNVKYQGEITKAKRRNIALSFRPEITKRRKRNKDEITKLK